jgi:hypothetical protein
LRDRRTISFDLDADGREELLVGINDDHLRVLENAGENRANRPLRIRLKGKPGNSRCIGARITVRLKDGSLQAAEVSAGGGYLSQFTTVLSFGLGPSGIAREITVRWPDGIETRMPAPAGSSWQDIVEIATP